MKTYAIIKVDNQRRDNYFTKDLKIPRMSYPVYDKELIRYAIDNAIEFGAEVIAFLYKKVDSMCLINDLMAAYYNRTVRYFTLNTREDEPFMAALHSLDEGFLKREVIYLDANTLVYGDIPKLREIIEDERKTQDELDHNVRHFVTKSSISTGIYVFKPGIFLYYKLMAKHGHFLKFKYESLLNSSAQFYNFYKKSGPTFIPKPLDINSNVHTFVIRDLRDIAEASMVKSLYK